MVKRGVKGRARPSELNSTLQPKLHSLQSVTHSLLHIRPKVYLAVSFRLCGKKKPRDMGWPERINPSRDQETPCLHNITASLRWWRDSDCGKLSGLAVVTCCLFLHICTISCVEKEVEGERNSGFEPLGKNCGGLSRIRTGSRNRWKWNCGGSAARLSAMQSRLVRSAPEKELERI